MAPPLDPRTTITDVAKLARVSIQTVSAVINQKPGISHQTTKRVLQAVDDLDYHPNILASSLRARRSLTVGVLIPSITNPFFPELVRGAEDLAHKNGYSLFLCNSDNDPRKEVSYLKLFLRHNVAGIIATHDPNRPLREQFLKRFIAQGIPVALLGSSPLETAALFVAVDHEQGSRTATDHLLELGHRRIGIITPPPNGQICAKRLAGFLNALTAVSLPADPELIFDGGFEVADGQTGARKLMALRRPPSAIVAANDLVAIGAINALRKLGRRVPQDVSVIGYDDIQLAALFEPGLTTIAQPLYEMGTQAMLAILNRIKDRNLPEEVVEFPTRLVVRDSTAVFPFPPTV